MGKKDAVVVKIESILGQNQSAVLLKGKIRLAMKRASAIALAVGCTVGSAYLAWMFFRPRQPDLVKEVYGRQAKRYGFDESWWIKVGYIMKRALNGGCRDLTADDYANLYKAMDSNVTMAQQPSIGILGKCPPADRDGLYARLDALARRSRDETVVEVCFYSMWEIAPSKHESIRQQIAASAYPDMGREVKYW